MLLPWVLCALTCCAVITTPSVSVCDVSENGERQCDTKLIVNFLFDKEEPDYDIQLTLDDSSPLILVEEDQEEIEYTVETPLIISVSKQERTVYGLEYYRKLHTYHETITTRVVSWYDINNECPSNCNCCSQVYGEDRTMRVAIQMCFDVDVDADTGDSFYYDVYRIKSPVVEYKISSTAVEDDIGANVKWTAQAGTWNNDAVEDKDDLTFRLQAVLLSTPQQNTIDLSRYYLFVRRQESSAQHKVVTTGSYIVPATYLEGSTSVLGADIEYYLRLRRQDCVTSDAIFNEGANFLEPNYILCPSTDKQQCYKDNVFNQFNLFWDFHFTHQNTQCYVVTESTDMPTDIVTYLPLSVRIQCETGSTMMVTLELEDGSFALIRKRAKPIIESQSVTILNDLEIVYNSLVLNVSKSSGNVELQLDNCMTRMNRETDAFDIPLELATSSSTHTIKGNSNTIFRIRLNRGAVGHDLYNAGFKCDVILSDNSGVFSSTPFSFLGEETSSGPGSSFNPLQYGAVVANYGSCQSPARSFTYSGLIYCIEACTVDERFENVPKASLPATVVGSIGQCVPVDCIEKYGSLKTLFDKTSRLCTSVVANTTPTPTPTPTPPESTKQPASTLEPLDCGEHGTYIPEPTHICSCESGYKSTVKDNVIIYCSEKTETRNPGSSTTTVTTTGGSGIRYEIIIVCVIAVVVVGIISLVVGLKVHKKRKAKAQAQAADAPAMEASEDIEVLEDTAEGWNTPDFL